MKLPFLLFILAVLASPLIGCHKELAASCKDGTLCTHAFQDGDALHLIVANRTNHQVVIPLINGLDTSDTRFLVAAVQEPKEKVMCVVKMRQIISRPPTPFPLGQYATAGMVVNTSDIRDSYCLPAGCRDYKVTFEIMPMGKSVATEGLTFAPHIVNLCL